MFPVSAAVGEHSNKRAGGAGEVAPWLEALAALPVDSSSGSGIHTSGSQAPAAVAQGISRCLLASMGITLVCTYPDIDTLIKHWTVGATMAPSI